MPTDEIKLWAMDGAGGATPLPAAQQTDTERLLEDTLVNNPDLLMPGLTLVGRQNRTEGGPLDLLGIDQDGRLTLFELKRGRLNRDAVAQIIDYGSWLEAMSDSELTQHIAENSGSRGTSSIDDFPEWYSENRNSQELSELRPVRLYLVGLGVDDTTTRMAQYLTDRGIDLSLLTFHGYTHNGQTLLARQMQVESPEEPETAAPRRRRPGRAELRNLLEHRIDDHNAENPEARELWDAVLAMFRENFYGPRELADGRPEHWFQRRLNFRIPGSGQIVASLQLASPGHTELVMPIFYRNAVGLCAAEFAQLRRDLPYWTYPANRRDVEATNVEVGFPIESLAKWATRQEQLAAVTRSVYQAFNPAYHGDDASENPE